MTFVIQFKNQMKDQNLIPPMYNIFNDCLCFDTEVKETQIMATCKRTQPDTSGNMDFSLRTAVYFLSTQTLMPFA